MFAVTAVAIAGLPLCVVIAPLLLGGVLVVAHLIDLVEPLGPEQWAALHDAVFVGPTLYRKLLGQQTAKLLAAEKQLPKPLAPKAPHFKPKAKRVIFLFMEGAMSQHDTFDYKPILDTNNGKPGPGGGVVTASKFKFKQYGETGSWFSELLPNIATHADELCWLRGLHTDTPAHPQAVVQLHTGSANAALTRPSMGSWLLYGLGTDNQDLPGYVTINPPPNFCGAVNSVRAFLPAHYQGTRISDQGFLPNVKAASAG